ncbi:MAG TPA: chemotaxis protein CheW [Kofleriaceae bacterium]|nr:chemotaxis protein CheW [Kofleriaceae bacterium]
MKESRTQSSTSQLLTFVVAGEEFGVDILRVQEIRGWSRPMPLPSTPSYIRGVINLRGDIVPIADLRERLGVAPLEPGQTTVIVVVRVEHARHTRTMGFVVDAMSDVTAIDASAVKPPPELVDTGGASMASGIALVEQRMITILDVDRVFPPNELAAELETAA